MVLNRLALLILLPYIAAAVIPWLNAEASLRVAIVALAWAVVCNVFVVGFLLGGQAQEAATAEGLNSAPEQDSLEAKPASHKLLQLGYTGTGLLAVLSLPVYFTLGPVWGLLSIMFAQWLNTKNLPKSLWWQKLPPVQQQFSQRLLFIALGCWLMLILSAARAVAV